MASRPRHPRARVLLDGKPRAIIRSRWYRNRAALSREIARYQLKGDDLTTWERVYVRWLNQLHALHLAPVIEMFHLMVNDAIAL